MGRVAVVTGGASGMGLAICERLADAGNGVAVLDINRDAADEVANSLVSHGATAVAKAVDVSDEGSVKDALAAVRSELGPVQIVVTSAGIAPYASFTEISLEQWNRILAVNLTGTFLCLQGVIPDMVASGWGRVVTISSASAQWGTARQTHYSASKGGVIALTKSLAREFGPNGITVNTISPGWIETPMSHQAQVEGNLPDSEAGVSRIPVRRLGTTDDIARACAFLCSDGAGYITGQVFGINGGMVIV